MKIPTTNSIPPPFQPHGGMEYTSAGGPRACYNLPELYYDAHSEDANPLLFSATLG